MASRNINPLMLAGATIDRSSWQANGLVAAWNPNVFPSGNTLYDVNGRWPLTLSGTTWAVDARFGYCLGFDAANNSYASVAVNITTGSTITFWAKHTSGRYMVVDDNAPANCLIQDSGSGWLDAYIGGDHLDPSGSVAISTDFAFYALNCGPQRLLYVNGSVVLSLAAAGISTITSLYFGNRSANDRDWPHDRYARLLPCTLLRRDRRHLRRSLRAVGRGGGRMGLGKGGCGCRQSSLVLQYAQTTQEGVLMMLPVDTAVVVTVGPLIDNTDFKSQETAIAYDAAGMSVDLIKSSGSATTKVDLTLTTGGVNDWTHVGSGYYEIEITAAQNDTEGTLHVGGICDGVLPFESPVYTIVPLAVYNSLVAGSDKLGVDAQEISSDSTAADNLELIIENAKGADHKLLLSTDAQDLSATLDVNTKTITGNAITAAAIADAAIDNATFAADVGSTAYATNIIALAVRKVLDELNLDHLMKVAVANRADMTTEVVDDTVLANIMTKTDGDTSDYAIATDSLEAQADATPDVAAYTADRAAKLDNLDATISSRATPGAF